ncbi:MAG TPA: hypothetical protein VG273_01920 [Bryobacteraceae bacterium]|jgi:hypothetical protein|nr:hypothetical protein [Bryobacteraceae bacterium]
MVEFADVARARESYELFAEAMNKGRDILVRAGIAAAPPPVPEFDAAFRRLDNGLRRTLFDELRKLQGVTTPDAMRIWQPLLKKAFGPPSASR